MPADIGQGTTLHYADASGFTSSTAVGELVDVGMPEITVDDVKVTHYGTTNGIHEFIPGWKTGEEVAIEVNHIEATEASLLALVGVAGKWWRITLPDSSYYMWSGYVNRKGGSIPNEDVIKSTMSVKINSLPTYTTA